MITKGSFGCHDQINERVGTLSNVLNNTKSFSRISQKVYKLIAIGNAKYLCELRGNNNIFVNWRIYSKQKNEQGRFMLFKAAEGSLKWSDGLCKILEGNGAAIEDRDVITGLEAFMLAAVGTSSDTETVYRLLQDHPAAINPYV